MIASPSHHNPNLHIFLIFFPTNQTSTPLEASLPKRNWVSLLFCFDWGFFFIFTGHLRIVITTQYCAKSLWVTW